MLARVSQNTQDGLLERGGARGRGVIWSPRPGSLPGSRARVLGSSLQITDQALHFLVYFLTHFSSLSQCGGGI